MTSSPTRTRAAVGGLGIACVAAAVALAGWPSSDSGDAGPAIVEAVTLRPGQAAGFVRDVNGNPVTGATVRVAGTDRAARSRSGGRYRIRIPEGRRTLVAEHPAHAAQYVAVGVRSRRGARVDFSLAVTDSGAAPRNSADRLLFWTGCEGLAGLEESDIDRYRERGVDGFVCSIQHLHGAGGEHAFSTDGESLRRDEDHDLQRRLRRSAAVASARRGQLDLYLAFYAVNYANRRTPFEEWFDNRAWRGSLLPELRRVAAAARALGFTGLAVDQELYAQRGDVEDATWSWDYPGNRRSEPQVRAQVARRGRQMMRALLRGYPGLELLAYDTQVPGAWSTVVQEEVNDNPAAFEDHVQIDLWNGLSSVQGYSAIRWLDATFYKTPHLGDWEPALRYNASRIYSMLSRRFSNWPYASSRLHVSPFAWLNAGPEGSSFEAARDPGYVAEQLAAFSRWGMGGTFANYAYGGLDQSDYDAYADLMREASSADTADRTPPELLITPQPEGDRLVATGERLSLAGSAEDDFAVRAVRWYDDRGRFGTAELEWMASGDPETGYTGETLWRIDGVPVDPGKTVLTIVAEDIKGLATVRALTVTR